MKNNPKSNHVQWAQKKGTDSLEREEEEEDEETGTLKQVNLSDLISDRES